MASGAVPVIRHWPGAETIYDQRWIRDSPAEMAAAIASVSADEASWRAAGALAREQAGAFDIESVARTWHALLTENRPASGASGPVYQTAGR
jgi:hypothetical protein